MKEIWNWVQLALAAVGGFLGWFFGGFDGFLYALLVFVVVDYITGVMCAIEGVSMLENAAHLGLPIPEKLKAALEQLHGREDGDGK